MPNETPWLRNGGLLRESTLQLHESKDKLDKTRRVVSPIGKPPCRMKHRGFEMVDCWRESTLQLHESKDKLDNTRRVVSLIGKPPCQMQHGGFEMVDCWRESTLLVRWLCQFIGRHPHWLLRD